MFLLFTFLTTILFSFRLLVTLLRWARERCNTLQFVRFSGLETVQTWIPLKTALALWREHWQKRIVALENSSLKQFKKFGESFNKTTSEHLPTPCPKESPWLEKPMVAPSNTNFIVYMNFLRTTTLWSCSTQVLDWELTLSLTYDFSTQVLPVLPC